MLVLTREIGQTIVIVDKNTGEKITVTITRIKENEARIGFECDKTKYNIFREELEAK
jgi:carbon storage regulator CsrA